MTSPTSTPPTSIDPDAPAYACDNAYLSLGDRRGMSTRTAFIKDIAAGLAARLPTGTTPEIEWIASVAVQLADAAIAAANRVGGTTSP